MTLPKIGDITVRWSRVLPSDPSSVTVIKDAAGRYFASFVAMLEYKARLYGRVFHRIGRWFPSSKLCSACGAMAESMPLNLREWRCACGAVHDRDVNAAINILAAGRADRLNACRDQVRPEPARAQVVETGSLRGAA